MTQPIDFTYICIVVGAVLIMGVFFGYFIKTVIDFFKGN